MQVVGSITTSKVLEDALTRTTKTERLPTVAVAAATTRRLGPNNAVIQRSRLGVLDGAIVDDWESPKPRSTPTATAGAGLTAGAGAAGAAAAGAGLGGRTSDVGLEACGLAWSYALRKRATSAVGSMSVPRLPRLSTDGSKTRLETDEAAAGAAVAAAAGAAGVATPAGCWGAALAVDLLDVVAVFFVAFFFGAGLAGAVIAPPTAGLSWRLALAAASIGESGSGAAAGGDGERLGKGAAAATGLVTGPAAGRATVSVVNRGVLFERGAGLVTPNSFSMAATPSSVSLIGPES